MKKTQDNCIRGDGKQIYARGLCRYHYKYTHQSLVATKIRTWDELVAEGLCLDDSHASLRK
jgi:hypothetical protein